MRRLLLVLGTLVAVVVALFLWRHRSGVEVTVRNDEAHPIRDVEVRTTAGAYPLGKLVAGQSASTLVGARGASSVKIAWTAADGTRKTRDADVYFEGSAEGAEMYGGTIEFVVADGRASSVSTLRLRFGPLSRGKPPAPR